MDKTLAGIVGAVGLLAGAPSHAAPARPAVLEAASYSDLLRPVPNAKAELAALDAQAPAEVELAQYYYAPPPPWYYRRYHHHHHHHGYYYRRYYHHHHHHHHHGW